MRIVKQIYSSKIFANFSTYLGLSILGKMLPFFLIPILTKYLSVEEYGLISLYTVFLTFLTPFVGIGLESNITKNFFREPQEYIAKIVFHLMIILLGSTLFTTLVVIILELINPKIVNIPPSWALTLPLLAFFNTIFLFNLVILRNQQNAKLFGFFEAFKLLLEFAASIFFVVLLQKGPNGQVYSLMFGSLVIGLLSYYQIWRSKYIDFNFDKDLLKSLFIISIPFIPHSIGGIIMNTSGRYFVDQYLGRQELAYYSIIFQFSQIFYILITIYNRSSQPWAYKTIAEANEQSKYKFVKMFYIYLVGAFVIGNTVAIASTIIMPYWVDPKFLIGTEYIFVLVNGFTFFGLYTLIFPYFIHHGKTALIGYITTSTTILNLALMMTLIPKYGIAGAAWGQFITNSFSFVLFLFFIQRIEKFPWLQFSRVFKTKLFNA